MIDLSHFPASAEIEVSLGRARGAVLIMDELLEIVLDAQHPVAAARVDGCEALLISTALAQAVEHARWNLIERMRALELAFEVTAAPRK